MGRNQENRQTRRAALGWSALALGGALMNQSCSSDGEDRGVATWRNAYSLDTERNPTSGSSEDLAAAIRGGADLRIQTQFRHNEHVDISSDNPEIVQEVAEFRATYLLDDRWVAGMMTLRQPISLLDDFGSRPSMSFFLYNQNGQQAIARPYLDGGPVTGEIGPVPPPAEPDPMEKYHLHDRWDQGTNAPSSNFIYDFDLYQFWVNQGWKEVLAHGPQGEVHSGTVEALADGAAHGQEVKVAIRGLCSDLAENGQEILNHEAFIHTNSCYYYTERQLFIAGTHPLVRVQPAIPLRYASRNWDFGWLMPRTDGFVKRWLVDPYTLKFAKSESRYPMRWFLR